MYMKKHNKKGVIIIFVFLFTVFFTSCNPDDDDNNNSYTDPREKFVGNWKCIENSNLYGQQTYNVTISLNSQNSTEILIANIYHLGYDQVARAITSNNYVTIPLQPICNNTNTIKGSGTFSGNNQIQLKYYVDDGADIDTCSATYTRL